MRKITAKLVTVCGAAALLIASAVTASANSCDGYARNYANDQANVGGNVIGGAAAGAAAGAIIGAILDGGRGAGRGAAIGGGTGAVGGGVNSGRRWQNNYDYAYRRCLENQSQARKARYKKPRRSNSRDAAYCARKYKSYNPNTGKYLSYSGRYRSCP